jgi:hypothetical protein
MQDSSFSIRTNLHALIGPIGIPRSPCSHLSRATDSTLVFKGGIKRIPNSSCQNNLSYFSFLCSARHRDGRPRYVMVLRRVGSAKYSLRLAYKLHEGALKRFPCGPSPLPLKKERSPADSRITQRPSSRPSTALLPWSSSTGNGGPL